MQAQDKNKDQLIDELNGMRRRLVQLEETEARLLETEKQLRECQERFQLFYEHSPSAYQSLNEDGCVLEVNQAWLSILGYSREDILGKWFGDFVAPEDLDHFRANFPKFKAAGESHGVEFRMVRKDGSSISVSFDGRIGRDQLGRFTQAHCILHHITEQQRMEEAVKQSEALLKNILSVAPVGLVRTRGMRIIWANHVWEKMFGFRDEQEYIGQRISVIYSSEAEFENARSMLYHNVRQGASETEALLRRKDGSVFDAHINISLLDPEDPAKGTLSDITDISDRKELEKVLAQSECFLSNILGRTS